MIVRGYNGCSDILKHFTSGKTRMSTQILTCKENMCVCVCVSGFLLSGETGSLVRVKFHSLSGAAFCMSQFPGDIALHVLQTARLGLRHRLAY